MPPNGKPDVLLLPTGSEVSLCVAAYEQLKAEGIKARVVSMPSWELFERQSQEYRDGVIPPGITPRVAVEQASTLGWERYAGRGGAIIGMHTFGMFAPLRDVQRVFGFEPEHVVSAAKERSARAQHVDSENGESPGTRWLVLGRPKGDEACNSA